MSQQPKVTDVVITLLSLCGLEALGKAIKQESKNWIFGWRFSTLCSQDYEITIGWQHGGSIE